MRSDTLIDSTLALARQSPTALLKLPGWLRQGKAALKRHITQAVELDVVHLPYNRALLQYLEQQHASGRPLYLATAADRALADRVAAHVGLFNGVFASDGSHNLAGREQARGLSGEISAEGFCYIGNASADLPHCSAPVQLQERRFWLPIRLRGFSPGLRSRKIVPTRSFVERSSSIESLAEGHTAASVGQERAALSSLCCWPMFVRWVVIAGRHGGLSVIWPLRVRHLHH